MSEFAMKEKTQDTRSKTDFERKMGVVMDPLTRKIVDSSEKAKNAYLDYCIFSQS